MDIHDGRMIPAMITVDNVSW